MGQATDRLNVIEEKIKLHPSGIVTEEDALNIEKQGILLGLQEYKEDLKKLAEIRRFAMNTIDCTTGVYCENLEKIRGMLK